ncbi:MAG: hypothetical protein C4522_03340 [Desulfobacteraceae bacterium]|nr:MAG: hypothetical protein C4522_03340 [Desulfobacteraceae bacterium]
MANLSQIGDFQQIPLTIRQHPYLMDHRFEDNAVFPAVEAMQILAASAKTCFPEINTELILNADFDKFLILQRDQETIEGFNELSRKQDGTIESKLVTRMKSRKLAILRQKEHVSVCFPSATTPEAEFPSFEKLISLEGKTFSVSSRAVYRELVPFGPSYHNITGDLLISENGVMANISAPISEASTDPLGSPFPLDAAFHAACVWCQCFLKFIGFPVGFEKRTIFRRTIPGNGYIARITPVKTSPEQLVCDLWICDPKGGFFENIAGLKMRDVSSGRRKPPEWITNMQSLDSEK